MISRRRFLEVSGVTAGMAVAPGSLMSAAAAQDADASLPPSLAKLKSRKNEAIPITREQRHERDDPEAPRGCMCACSAAGNAGHLRGSVSHQERLDDATAAARTGAKSARPAGLPWRRRRAGGRVLSISSRLGYATVGARRQHR